MITLSDEVWATTTLRDAQDPGAGAQEWEPLSRLTLERYNLIFAQQHSRGYATTGQPEHDAATALENGFATLCKVSTGGASTGALGFTKWSVASGLEIDDAPIIDDGDISDTARPSIEVVAGVSLTIRVFYVGESDANIYYKESVNGGTSFGDETAVGALANVKAIASVSTTKVHCVSYTSGNSRFHCYEDDGGWAVTDSLLYWPHRIEHIDAISVGDRDLILFYSPGPMYGTFREAGIYGLWYKHGRWSDLFKIDVLDESTDYAYRKDPMISVANGIYFLTGWLSEGDDDYSHAIRFLKTSKDGQHWSQYRPLVTCPEVGPAKMLVIDAASGQSWSFSTGQQVYLVGFDKIYESDATRLVGEENTDLQVNVTDRTLGWSLTRGVIAQGNTILGNHDGELDAHSIINADNSLLLKREAGYCTTEGEEYAQLTLEQVDFIKETDRLPQRHKQVASRDFMAWLRDNEADHFEEWESQLVGYDNYHDNTETGYGGLSHTATQAGWWRTAQNMLWLVSDNEEGVAFATWDSRIMNGQAKAMVRIETASNDEYAGVIFRAHDKANFLCAYYDETTDKILLRHKYNGVWKPTLASSSALSWSVDTFYGIMIDFRYSYIRVFYSTDGNTWTQAFTHVLTQGATGAPPKYGYVGVIGYGYSDQDEDEEPGYDPPLPPPGPSPEDLGPIGPAVAGHTEDGYYVTGEMGESWEQRNTGLINTDIWSLIWDSWWFTEERQGTNDPDQVIVWASGVGWVAKKVGPADWEIITPGTDPPNTWSDTTPPTAATVTYKQILSDIHAIDVFYLLVEWQEVDSGNDLWRGWIAKTADNGQSYTWFPLAGGETAYEVLVTSTDVAYNQIVLGDSHDFGATSPALGFWVVGTPEFTYTPGANFAQLTLELEFTNNQAGWQVCQPTGFLPCFGDGLGGYKTYTDTAAIAGVGGVARTLEIVESGGNNPYVRSVRLVADTFQNEECRPLAMDLDTNGGTRLYTTVWSDGDLYVQNRSATDLTVTHFRTFGAATESQVADKTYFIVPRSPHSLTASGFGDYVWVFGRYNDGSEKHLAYSVDGAATFTEKNDAAWDSNHLVGAFDVLYDLTTAYALLNHATAARLWKSVDTAATWSDINSVPFNVAFDALSRCNWSESEEFLIASNAAGATMAAWLDKDYTGTWGDATGDPSLPTASGFISSIIWV